MLTQAGRLLGIFKTCASVPAGEPWGVEGTLVLWACLSGLWGAGGWRKCPLLDCLPLRPAHHPGTHTTPSSHWAGTPKPGEFLGCCRAFLSVCPHMNQLDLEKDLQA